MTKELYEDVLAEEPIADPNNKKYKDWEKRLHKSIGWIEPEERGEFLYERRENGKIKLNSSPLSNKIVWSIRTEDGSFDCENQENAEILSLVLQMNERLKRMEKKLQKSGWPVFT